MSSSKRALEGTGDKGLKNIKSQAQNIIHIFNQTLKIINNQKEIVQKILEQISSTIESSIKIIQDAIDNSNIIQSFVMLNQQNLQTEKFISQQLKTLEQLLKGDLVFSQLQQLHQNSTQLNQIVINEAKIVEYKLLDQYKRSQKEMCCAIAFNEESTIIFYGCEKIIKINKFQDGLISNEITQLYDHTGTIFGLEYMKKCQELVSASYDGTVRLWNRNNYGIWQRKQVLTGHGDSILSFVINQHEDLLISGSRDQQIKFWQYQEQGWICKQTMATKFESDSLSINDQSNKLIACGYQAPVILVIQLTEKLDWNITQTIKVEKYGIRLCFINSTTFVFQLNMSNELQIYQYEQQIKQFKIIQDIQIGSSSKDSDCIFFPCQFIKSKQILVVKNYKLLNIMQKQENGIFKILQSIDFQNSSFYGSMTNDGSYLVTWEQNSKTFQVRKLEWVE